jgi:hypothetical protein
MTLHKPFIPYTMLYGYETLSVTLTTELILHVERK